MLLMEAGLSYNNRRRLHKASYLRELLAGTPDIDDSVRSLLRQCREMVVRRGKTESALIRSLQSAASYTGLRNSLLYRCPFFGSTCGSKRAKLPFRSSRKAANALESKVVPAVGV
jgi:hypothetical protein